MYSLSDALLMSTRFSLAGLLCTCRL